MDRAAPDLNLEVAELGVFQFLATSVMVQSITPHLGNFHFGNGAILTIRKGGRANLNHTVQLTSVHGTMWHSHDYSSIVLKLHLFSPSRRLFYSYSILTVVPNLCLPLWLLVT